MNSQSMIINPDDSALNANSIIDEYADDEDPGFELYECEVEHFKETCKSLSEQYDFPRRGIRVTNKQNIIYPKDNDSNQIITVNTLTVKTNNTDNNDKYKIEYIPT